jgi:hypothetical protein
MEIQKMCRKYQYVIKIEKQAVEKPKKCSKTPLFILKN